MDSLRDIFTALPDDGFGLIDNRSLAGRMDSMDAPFVLDIRKALDWMESRIPGSFHCEWEEVGAFVESGALPESKDIVVVCYVGQSSAQVAGILRAGGYRAYSLLDGFNEWRIYGHPVESTL